MIANIILFLSFFFLCLTFLFLYLGMVRNDNVAKHLYKLLDEVSAKAKKDIFDGADPTWRYDKLNEVFNNKMYSRMVWMFWKKLDSFYDRDKFLK